SNDPRKQRLCFDLPPDAPPRQAPSDPGAIRRLLRRELKISDRDYVVLMVGSGFRTKGADRAMKAIAALPPELRRRTVLVIIGHDNFRPFRRLARRLNILSQIIFFHGRDDIPRFLFSADLLMHPAYRETTGLVLIEAMAAGLPVLATDVCGYSHYIAEARAGWLVPSPFHQNALNRMLADMLQSPQREDWRRNGRDYIARRDVFSMHSKAADIIEQVAIC
nr:glycosyltransferase family 4 protein [Desulfobacterales bacterium]